MDYYGGRDPRDLPAYTLRHASTYLQIPSSTLRAWCAGRSWSTSTGRQRSEPVLTLPRPAYLSFTNLVEAHVLASIRAHRVTLESIRHAVAFVGERMGMPHPLAHAEFVTDGVDLFVEEMGRMVNVTREGQIAMKGLVSAYLRRIERGPDGVAARFFPVTRTGAVESPRIILIDPCVSFGRPILVGVGVTVDAVVSRFQAGESTDELADDLDCGKSVIEEAIRYYIPLAA